MCRPTEFATSCRQSRRIWAICRQRSQSRRVGGVNAPVGSRRELVAICRFSRAHWRHRRRPRDSTRRLSRVGDVYRARDTLGVIDCSERIVLDCTCATEYPSLGGIAIRHVCWFVRMFVRSFLVRSWKSVRAEYLDGYNGAPVGNGIWRIEWSRDRWAVRASGGGFGLRLIFSSYWCHQRVLCCRKWRWTWRWWTMIGLVLRNPSDTWLSGVQPRAPSWNTGATCSPTLADPLPSGTLCARLPKRTS